MSNNFWQPSAEQRRTILLLEALGLIHDLGKLSDTFLLSQEPSPDPKYKNYSYDLLADPRQISIYKDFTGSGNKVSELVQEWLNNATNTRCAFNERSDLTAILERINFTDWTNTTYTFAELSPLLAKPGLANAISPDNWKHALGKGMHPGLLIGALHGVAHVEKDRGEKKDKQPYFAVFSASPFGKEERIDMGVTSEALKALPLDRIEQITTEQRRAWLKEMRTWMRRGLADNRRPHNEVSLWDWGFVVASMTKAAAAYIYKNGWPINLKCLPFCALRISLNRLEIYIRSDKISDLLGVRKILDDAFEQVRILLEETYALGNCIYHDETGAYYLLSKLYDDAEKDALREEVQALFPPDLRPRVYWGKEIKAGKLDEDKTLARELVVEPRKSALREPPVCARNNLYLFKDEWGLGRPENAETCTVCGVRPVGFPREGFLPEVEQNLAPWATQRKAEQRNICRVCLERRGRRAQSWLKSDLQGTIWTNEVADDNGRLALFIGKLGLEGWLDGLLLDTVQDVRTIKHPSPARLYRIAETARGFWEGVSTKLMLYIIGQHPYRLALYPDSPLDLDDFHTYELEVDGVSLSVVWDEANRRFLTAENLNYFHKRWKEKNKTVDQLSERLKQGVFNILESSEYGRPGQVLLKTRINQVTSLGGYCPVIPILAEPSIFMALIPANNALALAKAVKSKYEEEMGRVRDRLPLYIGLVFCRRRTPIRALLEAGRSMLEMAGTLNMDTGDGWEAWELLQKNSPVPSIYELNFDNEIVWNMPVLVGGCKTEDKWYPKMYEGDTWEEKQVKHVSELSCPAKVWVRPSRFDFEYLDTNVRRFDIHYDEKGRRSRRTRPFYLEDLDRFEKLWAYMRCLAKAQRQQVVRMIEATREAWYGQTWDLESIKKDEVFKQFVEDTLAGATWPINQLWKDIPQEWQKKLIQAGVKGELADLNELYTEILKE